MDEPMNVLSREFLLAEYSCIIIPVAAALHEELTRFI